MKYFLIFILIIFVTHISDKKTNEYDYPGLGMLIEAYYFDYYEYPNNINDLILYCNANQFPIDFNTTIKKLNKNRDKITFSKKENYLIITLKDSILYKTELRTPCSEFSYNLPVYLNKVLLFDKNGYSISSEKIINEFKADIKEIKKKYDKVKKEKNTNTYITNKHVMIKFIPSEGLSLFCKDDIQLKDFKYFQEMEKYLIKFSDKYELTKVVLTTPVFYR